MDDPQSSSVGYNFRYADYYRMGTAPSNSVLYRDLMKVYGIRIIFVVYGQAGKFDAPALTITLGSGVALLGIATLLCDFLITNFSAKKIFYRTKKYELINDDFDPDEQAFFSDSDNNETVTVPADSEKIGNSEDVEKYFNNEFKTTTSLTTSSSSSTSRKTGSKVVNESSGLLESHAWVAFYNSFSY